MTVSLVIEHSLSHLPFPYQALPSATSPQLTRAVSQATGYASRPAVAAPQWDGKWLSGYHLYENARAYRGKMGYDSGGIFHTPFRLTIRVSDFVFGVNTEPGGLIHLPPPTLGTTSSWSLT